MLDIYKKELKEKESEQAQLLQQFQAFCQLFQKFATNSQIFQKQTNQNFEDLKELLTINGDGDGNLLESLLKAIQDLKKSVESDQATKRELIAELRELRNELED